MNASQVFRKVSAIVDALTDAPPRRVRLSREEREGLETIRAASLGVELVLDAVHMHNVEIQVMRPFEVEWIEVLEPEWILHSISSGGREWMPAIGEQYRIPLNNWKGRLPTLTPNYPLILSVSHELRAVPDIGTKIFQIALHGTQVVST